MTTATDQPANATVQTVLRVAGQLTDNQLHRLGVARTVIDDFQFGAAWFRAHAVDTAAAESVDAQLASLTTAVQARYGAWARDHDARMREVAGAHPTAERWGEVGLACAALGTPLLVLLAAVRVVPWGAPVVALAVGFLMLVASSAVLGHRLTRHTRARADLLNEAWRAVEGALLASASAHTIGQPGGLRAEEYELLTRPWSTQILPLPHMVDARR